MSFGYGRPVPTSPFTTRILAGLGLLGVAVFVACIVALHAVAAKTTGLPWHMSLFVRGPLGWLWPAGLISLALGATAQVLALRHTLPKNGWSRFGLVLLWLVILSTIVVAAFPADRGDEPRTVAGEVHDTATVGPFAILVLAMVVMALAFRTDAAWRPLLLPSLGLAAFSIAAGAAYVYLHFQGTWPLAVAQRAAVAGHSAWLILLGVHVHRLVPDDALPGSPLES